MLTNNEARLIRSLGELVAILEKMYVTGSGPLQFALRDAKALLKEIKAKPPK